MLQFASISEQLAGQTEVTAGSLQPGGVFRNVINRYYNPIPAASQREHLQLPCIWQSDLSGSWTPANSSNQYTNWDQSLDRAGVQLRHPPRPN